MCDNKGNMVYCSSCGEKLQEGDLFCFSCGTKVDYAIDSSLKQKSTRFGRVGKLLKSGHCRIIILASIVLSIILLSCHLQKKDGLYMVIDISSGIESSRFPVEYMDDIPDGDWNDEYKTNKIVLRRIEPGEFSMGSPEGETGRELNETQHKVKITKPYYIGVFEITQRQWELVTGGRPSSFCREPYYKKRPVENVSYEMVRGYKLGMEWPNSSAVDADSFIGILRKKTGENGLDLPTEAQWEYACRAGCTNALNVGMDVFASIEINHEFCVQKDKIVKAAEIARCNVETASEKLCDVRKVSNVYGYENGVYDSKRGTAVVGSYAPNSWGLYDMIGNVKEMCLDVMDFISDDEDECLMDPLGPENSEGPATRVGRGGSWKDGIEACRSASRTHIEQTVVFDDTGLRICYNAEPLVASDNAEKTTEIPAEIKKLKGLVLGEPFPEGLKECVKPALPGLEKVKLPFYCYQFTPDKVPERLRKMFFKPEWLEECIALENKVLYSVQLRYKAETKEDVNERMGILADLIGESLGIKLNLNKGDINSYYYGTSQNYVKLEIDCMRQLLNKQFGIVVEMVDSQVVGGQGKDSDRLDVQKQRSLCEIFCIKPEGQEDGIMEKMSGFLGFVFGSEVDSEQKNNTRSVVKRFDIQNMPLGFSEGVLFGTSKTRKLYMIRAVLGKKNENDFEYAFDSAINIIECAFGISMKKDEDGSFCGTKEFKSLGNSGEPRKISFAVRKLDEIIFIDVKDVDLEMLHIQEAFHDNPLSLIPELINGKVQSVVKGALGYEFGDVIDERAAKEESGFYSMKKKIGENKFGISEVILYAGKKRKRIYCIKGTYEGSDARKKCVEIAMYLKECGFKLKKEEGLCSSFEFKSTPSTSDTGVVNIGISKGNGNEMFIEFYDVIEMLKGLM